MILSLDPGEQTGYIVGCAVDEGYGVTIAGQFPLWHMVESLIDSYKPSAIVYESFRLYPQAARAKSWSSFPTVEVIGVVKYLAEKYGIKLVAQPASIKKNVALKRHVVGVTGPHARDALRHLIYFIEKESK